MSVATNETIETDYLIVGAGAIGMAFLDELVHRTTSKTFVIVDRESSPGGHWHHAYSFVRLHQGSQFYGVNSERLERVKGRLEYATKYELLAYYEMVMDKLMATGRVRFLSCCDYVGDGIVRSLMASNKEYHINVKCKTVDAISAMVKVPSTHEPSYKVAPTVNFIPVNGLTSLKEAYNEYVIMGNGKTGIDAVLFLLDRGVNPSNIKWIISRDFWWFDRARIAPDKIFDWKMDTCTAIAEEKDADAIVERLHREKILYKIHDDVDIRAFRCATITPQELNSVRRVTNCIRLGKVRRIDENGTIILEKGMVETSPTSTLHVDCTACGIPRRPVMKVFKDENTIVLQSMALCQSVWSAAVIAMVEANETEDDVKNSMTNVCPMPDTPENWVHSYLTQIKNVVALKPHQKDLDGMRLKNVATEWYFQRMWKGMTQFAPLLPTLLEKAEQF